MKKTVKGNDLFFAKVKENAIIPTKDSANMGYDVYACFDEPYMVIKPHQTRLIPTGIASAVSEDYAIVLKERSSTGSKGIAQRCGVIDSNYRGEWFVPITNTTNNIIIISKLDEEETIKEYCDEVRGDMLIYPYSKAITQAVILPVPKMNVNELSYEQLCEYETDRGTGALGSTGK